MQTPRNLSEGTHQGRGRAGFEFRINSLLHVVRIPEPPLADSRLLSEQEVTVSIRQLRSDRTSHTPARGQPGPLHTGRLACSQRHWPLPAPLASMAIPSSFQAVQSPLGARRQVPHMPKLHAPAPEVTLPPGGQCDGPAQGKTMKAWDPGGLRPCRKEQGSARSTQQEIQMLQGCKYSPVPGRGRPTQPWGPPPLPGPTSHKGGGRSALMLLRRGLFTDSTSPAASSSPSPSTGPMGLAHEELGEFCGSRRAAQGL